MDDWQLFRSEGGAGYDVALEEAARGLLSELDQCGERSKALSKRLAEDHPARALAGHVLHTNCTQNS